MQKKSVHPRVSRIALVLLAIAVPVLLSSFPAFGKNSQNTEVKLISITASNTPLAAVLERVCRELGITCTSVQTLSDPVTCELLNTPPGEALQQVLADWNSVFVYDKESGSPSKVSVLSRKKARLNEEASAAPAALAVVVTRTEKMSSNAADPPAKKENVASPPTPPPTAELGLYGKGVFVSPDRLALQKLDKEAFHEGLRVENAPLTIPAVLPSGAPAPQKNGVRIGAVNNDLLRDGLVLREGDVVRIVNDTPVDDPEKFISQLTDAIADGTTPILRLEVERTEPTPTENNPGGAAPAEKGKTIIEAIYIDLSDHIK